jgi:hypothetical protein
MGGMKRISPMEHADFKFSLVSSKSNADLFPSREAAGQFASGIRESRVHPYQLGAEPPVGFVVQVGPWMFAKDIRPN